MGVAPTGRAIRMNALMVLKFTDGRVVERWMTADQMGLMNQIS